MNTPEADAIAAAHVVNAGKMLYGEHWIAPLAARLNVNERTMRRIAAAARDRTGYPAARNLIEPIQQTLTQLALEALTTADNMNEQRPAMALPPAFCTTFPMAEIHAIGRRPEYLVAAGVQKGPSAQ